MPIGKTVQPKKTWKWGNLKPPIRPMNAQKGATGLSVEVGGGGGWGGLGRGSHRRRVPTASVSFPHQHDWVLPRLSGLTAPQTVDGPRTPPRRWWEGDTAVPVCMSRALRACGGFRALGQGTVAHLLSPLGCGPPVSVWGGDVCAQCSGPQQRGRGALH